MHEPKKTVITDGIIRIYHDEEENHIFAEYYKINNKREGIFKKFNYEGNLSYICNYVNNRKNGDEFEYDNNNTLLCKTQYLNGKKNGEYIKYNPNRTIKEKIMYLNDKKMS